MVVGTSGRYRRSIFRASVAGGFQPSGSDPANGTGGMVTHPARTAVRYMNDPHGPMEDSP
ncbi:hypothetical protein MILUP08_40351 [Micromonospora lupini str. Lupac 08]|uniref:Uncharacterized protein n=1 Tax=Micromonospora lupini str. Lupac 08 TaxID=1150864 RepID=I0KV48_9ACTN|nr:hypothetical protein MILUP08_40351 [Micromonospora lupini str. Lupac 08]